MRAAAALVAIVALNVVATAVFGKNALGYIILEMFGSFPFLALLYVAVTTPWNRARVIHSHRARHPSKHQ